MSDIQEAWDLSREINDLLAPISSAVTVSPYGSTHLRIYGMVSLDVGRELIDRLTGSSLSASVAATQQIGEPG